MTAPGYEPATLICRKPKGSAMLLSELHKQLKGASDEVLQCDIYLASPDPVPGDDIDVRLTRIASVDIDRDRGEIRLVPVCVGEPTEAGIPIVLLSILLEQLPFDTVLWGDFEIMAELPLEREAGRAARRSYARITSLHVGLSSGEAWFLVRPRSEYASNALPG